MSPGRDDEGNAMVEFALWLPIVLIALCGCLQLTAQLYAQRVAGQAAEQAARARAAGEDPAAVVPDEATVTVVDGAVRVDMPVRQYILLLPQRFAEVTAEAPVSGGVSVGAGS